MSARRQPALARRETIFASARRVRRSWSGAERRLRNARSWVDHSLPRAARQAARRPPPNAPLAFPAHELPPEHALGLELVVRPAQEPHGFHVCEPAARDRL